MPHQPVALATGLKCLSAFGFWGTAQVEEYLLQHLLSQMPFGFWVLGDQSQHDSVIAMIPRSQMPFGFWVLGDTAPRRTESNMELRLKCLSAFGFWGTKGRVATIANDKKVSNAFRLLGSGGLQPDETIPL